MRTQEEKLLDLRAENKRQCVKCKESLPMEKVLMDLETSRSVNIHSSIVLYCDDCWLLKMKEMSNVASEMLFKRDNS